MANVSRLSRGLIALIAEHNVWLYELLHPHVMFGQRGLSHMPFSNGIRSRERASELNPQPLPPVAIATFVGHMMGRRLADFAISVNAQGGQGMSLLAKEIDDWCGTGPHIIHWPKNWPFPPPEPEPHPDWDMSIFGPHPEPWISRQVLLAGAIALIQTAAGFPEGEMRDGFAKQADVLMEKGLSLKG